MIIKKIQIFFLFFIMSIISCKSEEGSEEGTSGQEESTKADLDTLTNWDTLTTRAVLSTSTSSPGNPSNIWVTLFVWAKWYQGPNVTTVEDKRKMCLVNDRFAANNLAIWFIAKDLLAFGMKNAFSYDFFNLSFFSLLSPYEINIKLLKIRNKIEEELKFNTVPSVNDFVAVVEKLMNDSDKMLCKFGWHSTVDRILMHACAADEQNPHSQRSLVLLYGVLLLIADPAIFPPAELYVQVDEKLAPVGLELWSGKPLTSSSIVNMNNLNTNSYFNLSLCDFLAVSILEVDPRTDPKKYLTPPSPTPPTPRPPSSPPSPSPSIDSMLAVALIGGIVSAKAPPETAPKVWGHLPGIENTLKCKVHCGTSNSFDLTRKCLLCTDKKYDPSISCMCVQCMERKLTPPSSSVSCKTVLIQTQKNIDSCILCLKEAKGENVYDTVLNVRMLLKILGAKSENIKGWADSWDRGALSDDLDYFLKTNCK